MIKYLDSLLNIGNRKKKRSKYDKFIQDAKVTMLSNNQVSVRIGDFIFELPAVGLTEEIKCMLTNDQIKKMKYVRCFTQMCEILYRNEYDSVFTLNEGDVVIDCGANFGFFTVYASKKIGTKGKVFAIEPDVANLPYLKKNLELNNIKNCVLVPVALSDKNGKAKLYQCWHTGSTLLKNKKYDNVIEIDVTTINAIIDKYKPEKIDFIKMDIEGAEIEALRGAEKTLKTFQPSIVIAAYHILLNGEKSFEFVKEIISEFGMNLISKENDYLVQANFNKLKNSI